MSLRPQYQKLVEDMQRYILRVYAPHDLRHMDKETFSCFRNQIKPAKAPVIKKEPILQVNEIKKSLPPIKAPPIPEKKPISELPKPEVLKTAFRLSSPAPEVNGQTFIFKEVEQILKKIAPDFKQLPEASLEELPTSEDEVAFICLDANERPFLIRIGEAIKEKLGASFVIKEEAELQDELKNSRVKFFIAQIESLQKHPIFKNFLSENFPFYLGGTPLLAMENQSAYEMEPQKKRLLWNEIKAFLKGEKSS